MDKLHQTIDAVAALLIALPAILRLLGLEDRPWAARLMKGGADVVGAIAHKGDDNAVQK